MLARKHGLRVALLLPSALLTRPVRRSLPEPVGTKGVPPINRPVASGAGRTKGIDRRSIIASFPYPASFVTEGMIWGALPCCCGSCPVCSRKPERLRLRNHARVTAALLPQAQCGQWRHRHRKQSPLLKHPVRLRLPPVVRRQQNHHRHPRRLNRPRLLPVHYLRGLSAASE